MRCVPYLVERLVTRAVDASGNDLYTRRANDANQFDETSALPTNPALLEALARSPPVLEDLDGGG